MPAMNPPPRNPSPRRKDDEVVRVLASETFNHALNRLMWKVLMWFVVTGTLTVGGTAWAVSAWATNQSRDIETNKQDIAQVKADNRELKEVIGTLATAVDSLRITIRLTAQVRNP